MDVSIGGTGRRKRKRTVEECRELSIGTFRELFHANAAERLIWKKNDAVVMAANFTLTWDTTPLIGLTYFMPDNSLVEFFVELKATTQRLGGERWWFVCPLIVRGVPCNRRVSTLFMPPGSKFFGCRHCLNLSYRSKQKTRRPKIPRP